MAARADRRQQAQEILLRCLREGLSLPVALRLAQVPKSTYYDWLLRYPDFAQQVERAEAEAVAALERAALELAIGERREGMIRWLLERRCPEVYRKQ